MIAYLRGAYTELTPTAVLVECAGVGYSVAISLTTYTALSGQKEGKILITEIIREDAHLLYGFATAAEQDLFRHLMTVSGVGPNTARIILSSYPPHELTSIITLGQIEPLKAIKGIGLKTPLSREMPAPRRLSLRRPPAARRYSHSTPPLRRKPSAP